ncbi:MAG: pyrroline-5-carboxylate reductase [Candidatus Gastranaerophilales bacterium]|nr:pyrroline-5-carboxylate reductase [Candidatus Gastranaerophilales bacterium]
MKIGFIGAGKLGSSIIEGLKKSSLQAEITAYDPHSVFLENLVQTYGLKTAADNADLVNSSDVVVIALKPAIVGEAVKELKNLFKDKLVISLAAGVNTSDVEEIAPDICIARVLTNTPSAFGVGMSTISKGRNLSEAQLELCKDIFTQVGEVIVIDEKFMDISTSLAGSGPAFFYAVAQGFAKGCEKLGMSEKDAILLSAQTMLGAAKMITSSGQTPEELIKRVATPGGCTIEGLNYLASQNLEKILIECMEVTAKKAAILAHIGKEG